MSAALTPGTCSCTYYITGLCALLLPALIDPWMICQANNCILFLFTGTHFQKTQFRRSSKKSTCTAVFHSDGNTRLKIRRVCSNVQPIWRDIWKLFVIRSWGREYFSFTNGWSLGQTFVFWVSLCEPQPGHEPSKSTPLMGHSPLMHHPPHWHVLPMIHPHLNSQHSSEWLGLCGQSPVQFLGISQDSIDWKLFTCYSEEHLKRKHLKKSGSWVWIIIRS